MSGTCRSLILRVGLRKVYCHPDQINAQTQSGPRRPSETLIGDISTHFRSGRYRLKDKSLHTHVAAMSRSTLADLRCLCNGTSLITATVRVYAPDGGTTTHMAPLSPADTLSCLSSLCCRTLRHRSICWHLCSPMHTLILAVSHSQRFHTFRSCILSSSSSSESSEPRSRTPTSSHRHPPAALPNYFPSADPESDRHSTRR